MAGLQVIHAEAVHQDQGLFEGAPAHRDIRLSAIRSALLQIDGRVEPQEILQGVGNQFIVANIQLDDGAVNLAER